MTADYRAQIGELQIQACGLPHGPSKVALLEEAVRLADVHQDVALGDELRDDLIEAATFSGYPEKALVVFSWRLAQSDRDPARFPESRLLWQYKWIAGNLTDFPQISRAQIEEAFDDMTRRFQGCGFGLRAINGLRWDAAVAMGEPDQARHYYRLWEKTPRDGNTDCIACEQDSRIYYHLFFNKRKQAVKSAEPILNGSLRCLTVPARTYGKVLLPLVQLGQVEKAAEYHQRGYRLIRNNREFLRRIGDHLTFLSVTDNLSQGVKLFEKHLELALETKDLSSRWWFFLAAYFFLGRIEESGQTTLKLRLPMWAPCYREEGRYDVADLSSWVEETCRDLAQRFDERNGNNFFARRLAAQRRLKRWLTPYPLGRSRKAE